MLVLCPSLQLSLETLMHVMLGKWWLASVLHARSLSSVIRLVPTTSISVHRYKKNTSKAKIRTDKMPCNHTQNQNWEEINVTDELPHWLSTNILWYFINVVDPTELSMETIPNSKSSKIRLASQIFLTWIMKIYQFLKVRKLIILWKWKSKT